MKTLMIILCFILPLFLTIFGVLAIGVFNFMAATFIMAIGFLKRLLFRDQQFH